MVLQSVLPQRVSGVLTPLRRDILLLVIALGLLSLPVLTSLGAIGTEDNQYERTQVVATGGEVRYVDATEVPDGTPISTDLICAGTQVERACALEGLLGNETRSLGVQSTADALDDDPRIAPRPYRFVQLDDGIYRALYDKNETDTVGIRLTETTASTALQAVSVNPSQPDSLNPDRIDVPDTVVDAAETGQASSRTAVDVPPYPIKIGDEYYRVYRVSEGAEGTNTPFSLLFFFGGGLGVVILLSLLRNVRFSYTPN
jgi:hypothetical protein